MDNFKKIENLIIWSAIIISTLLFFILVKPLFGEGIPMNVDLPFHYGRLVCFDQSGWWNLPSVWCAYGQAGIASSQAYALLPFMIMIALSKIIGTLLAYKITLVLIHMILPISVFLLFWMNDWKIAGAFSYAFLILERGSWHSGGFVKLFGVGLLANAMGSGLLILTLAMAIMLYKNPSWKNVGLASLVTGIACLSHPGVFMLYPAIFIVLTAYFWKTFIEQWKKISSYLALSLFIPAFWWIPYLAKKSFYVSASGGGILTLQQVKDYLITPMNKWILVLALIGIIITLIYYRKEIHAFIFIGILGILVAFFLTGIFFPDFYQNFIYFKFIQSIRHLGEIRTVLLVMAAISLYWCFKKWKYAFIPVTIIFFFLVFSMFNSTMIQSNSITLSSHESFGVFINTFAVVNTVDDGRILVEDTLFNYATNQGILPPHVSHSWSIAPAYTTAEFLGLGDNLYNTFDYSNTQRGILFNRPLESYDPDELDSLFDDLNIKYAFVYTDIYKSNLEKKYVKILEITGTPWTAYKTLENPSYFIIKQGNITSQEYNKTKAKISYTAESNTEVLFKVRNFPNWKAYMNGKELKTESSERGLIKVKVPPGSNIIDFKYQNIPVDYISYIPTIIGIITCLTLIFLKQKETSQTNE